MVNKKQLPSFFVVGSQKSGTTTIHNLLKQNKYISLPEYKETHFFSMHFNRGINWYLSQFTKGNYQIRGEVDPSYMFFPNTYKNIKKINKSSKFIFIFRNPLDRAYSHYLMSSSRGYEKLSFIDAISKEKERLKTDENLFSFSNHSYILRSQYTEQIKEFLKYFDTNEKMFLKFDDLLNIDTRKEIYFNICKFLNINQSNNIDFNKQSNKASIYRSKILTKNLYSDTYLRRILKKIIFSKKIRNKIRTKLYSVNSIAINNIDLIKNKEIAFKNLSKKHIEWNNEEVIKLQKITNLELENWIL